LIGATPCPPCPPCEPSLPSSSPFAIHRSPFGVRSLGFGAWGSKFGVWSSGLHFSRTSCQCEEAKRGRFPYFDWGHSVATVPSARD
jgi:hypothetical protein